MEKIAIVDVDGTLLNWRHHFETWALKWDLIQIPNPDKSTFISKHDYNIKNLINIFNETIHISRLPPEQNAIKGINRIHQEGFAIKICSSFSSNYESMKMREKNLTNVFGNIFAEYKFIPFIDFTDVDGKLEYIKQNLPLYNDVILIEDNPHIIRGCLEQSILAPESIFMMEQSFNLDDAIKLSNEYDIVTGDWDDIIEGIFGE